MHAKRTSYLIGVASSLKPCLGLAVRTTTDFHLTWLVYFWFKVPWNTVSSRSQICASGAYLNVTFPPHLVCYRVPGVRMLRKIIAFFNRWSMWCSSDNYWPTMLQKIYSNLLSRGLEDAWIVLENSIAVFHYYSMARNYYLNTLQPHYWCDSREQKEIQVLRFQIQESLDRLTSTYPFTAKNWICQFSDCAWLCS